MTLILKILLAHLIGDFVLQPDGWVKNKMSRKLKSGRLYLHLAIHAVLLALFLEFDTRYWLGFVIVIVSHYIFDAIKVMLYLPRFERSLFFIDQLLHLVVIVLVAGIYEPLGIDISSLFDYQVLLLVTFLVFLSQVSAIVIKIVMLKWGPFSDEPGDIALARAGRFIGILERLLVFLFIVTGHWEAIGFLLAAKSVFRFGDLKESHDRKLTEYVLIGTLLSFGMAILSGMLYLYLI